jgi:uncharacterized membrane protein YtjA (UPF0391 family)
MLRWLGALMVLSVLAGLLTFGVIPSEAVGMSRILFGCYTGLLFLGLVVGLVRGA